MLIPQSHLRALCSGLVLAAGLAAGAVVLPKTACAGSEIVTDAPPPPDRVEHAPPSRDGYVWGAGHWEWNRHSYVWVSGTWIPERRASHWVAGRWEPVGTQWRYIDGHWEH